MTNVSEPGVELSNLEANTYIILLEVSKSSFIKIVTFCIAFAEAMDRRFLISLVCGQ